MMKNRKLLVLPLIAALGLFCVLGLSACGSGGEKVDDATLAEQAVRADLDMIKNVDDEMLSEVITPETEATFGELGLSASDFMKVYLEGFDYSISSVTVEGDTAAVDVTFTCKSYDQLMEAADSAAETLLADPDVYNYSEEELYSKLGELMMTEMQSKEPVEGETFTLTYVKNGDEWVLEDTADNSNAIGSHLITVPAE